MRVKQTFVRKATPSEAAAFRKRKQEEAEALRKRRQQEADAAARVGPPGPRGPQGQPGINGAPGRDGIDGAPGKNGEDGWDGWDGADGKDGRDGTTWLTGPRDPRKSDGVDSDVWLNTKSLDLFKKRDGAWKLIANIRGKDGFPGPPGPRGRDGTGTGRDGAFIWIDDGDPPEGGVVGQQIFCGDGDPL